MKTDSIFYRLFQDFPQLLFELIGKQDANFSAYEFKALEVKERAFRLDCVVSPLKEFPREPLHFVEIQGYKDDEFYERLFGSIFLYFSQYQPPYQDGYAIVIYLRRSHETPAHPRYRALMEPHVRRLYLEDLPEATEESLGMAILKLVVEAPGNTSTRARQLIDKAREELTDDVIQQKIIEWIKAIVLYKLPKLSREEIEAMMLDCMPEVEGRNRFL